LRDGDCGRGNVLVSLVIVVVAIGGVCGGGCGGGRLFVVVMF
jgi:hypothetical protein